MKRFFTLFISLLTVSMLAAQSWAEIGTTWTYSESYATSPGVYPVTFQCIKDTLWQGRLCKLIIKGDVSCDFRPDHEITYADSGRVYYYDSLTASFQILYDINTQSGQSWVNYPDGYQSGDSIITIVDSTSSVIINGISLKKLFVHFTSVGQFYGGTNNEDTIIEYMGNQNSMFDWAFDACDENYIGGLRCFSDSTIGSYDFHVFPTCDYIVSGIRKLPNGVTVKLYPDPATTETFLDYSFTVWEGVADLQITNILGQVVYRQTLTSFGGALKLDISQFANGIYNVAIKQNSETTGIARFIKQ